MTSRGYGIMELNKEDWSPLLKEMSDPPKQLYYAGRVPDYSRKFLCVVGTRKYSQYGKEAAEYLIQGLKDYPITIVSGLALGIDSIAHRTALRNKLPTIAMPGSGLHPNALHPQSHVGLAEEIVNVGGTLISEMEPEQKASLLTHNTSDRKVFFSFPRRNRLMVGISHAILVIEAQEKSGTMITAKYTSDYNRDLLVVPGSIFSPNSEGPLKLLRIGATPIRSPEDILEVLGLDGFGFTSPKLGEVEGGAPGEVLDCSPDELILIKILKQNPLPKDELLPASGLKAADFQMAITLLELKGLVEEKLGEMRLI